MEVEIKSRLVQACRSQYKVLSHEYIGAEEEE